MADYAFALSKYLMKPYSQTRLTTEKRVFNYRLSRARRTVENTFGILANRFRVFMTPISLCPEKVKVVTLASCLLHNYLCCHATAQTVYTPPASLDTEDPVTHELYVQMLCDIFAAKRNERYISSSTTWALRLGFLNSS